MDNIFRFWHRRSSRELDLTKNDHASSDVQRASGTGSFNERVIHVRSPYAALTISAVYRAVGLIARTEGQFQMQYQRLNKEGGNFVQSMWGDSARLNYLLQVRPNPMMTASAFIQGLVISKLQNGNGIAYIDRNENGEVDALWLCTGASYNEASGQYDLRFYTRDGLRTLNRVDAGDVIHIPNTYKTESGWGIPTIRFALDTLSLIKTESRQALETAAKGGRVKLIVGEEKPANGQGTLAFGLLNKEQVDRYASELNARMYEQDVIGIRGLDKVQNISMSAQDQQLVELLGMGINDVCRFYGCQRPLLMEDTNSHYTTYQNARQEFFQWTIQPDIKEIEEEFAGKLLLPGDYGKRKFHMCEQPIMRLDKESQAKVDQVQLQTGAATVNEIRQQYDRPAVEGGDIIYVSTNLAELGSDKLRGVQGNSSVNEKQGEDGLQ